MSERVPVALVVAVASNGIIGRDGDMPWKLSTDLKRFKRDTMGKPIIMGRKTHHAIGSVLPGRLNIIVTRSGLQVNGAVTASSIEEAMKIATEWALENGSEEICIVGGGQIYAKTIALADRLYVTRVMAEPEGDTRFPEITEEQWKIVHKEVVPRGEQDTAETVYTVYERI